MRYARILAGAVLGAALMVGCEKRDEKATQSPPAAQPAPRPVPPPPAEQLMTPTTLPSTQPTAPAAQLNVPQAPKVDDVAAAAPADVAPKADPAVADAQTAAKKTKKAAAAKAEAAKVDAVAKSDALAKEAESKLMQILDYVKENKFELADTALKQLEGMKSSLPAAIQTKIDAARTALTAAKAGNLKLPQIPGLGN